MRTGLRIGLLALVAVSCGMGVVGFGAEGEVFPARPTVVTLAGEYGVMWLELEGKGGAVRVFVATRGGKAVQFWSTNMKLPGVEKLEGSPKLLTDAVRGETKGAEISAEVDVRWVSIWAPQKLIGEGTVVLKLVREGEKVTGTYAIRGMVESSGKVTGRVMDEAEAKKVDGIAAGQDWPGFYGAMSAGRGPAYGKGLVDDLSKARPVWRSEAVSLSGWGTGVDSRYKARAAFGTLCGGSSSPVVADGLVYLYHYRPSGDVEVEGADKELVETFAGNAYAKESMRRYFSKRADVVVTCMDGATGKTVWESVWPMKQGNYQTHKWRGYNHTPSVGKGVLVVSDYSMGLHGFDAKTGELKWTRGGGGVVSKDNGAIGPVISGDVVVWTTGGGTVGLDLQSGKELWKGAKSEGARRMVVGGKERVLLVGETLRLVEAESGKEVAKGEFPGGFDNKGKKQIGRGPGANLVCEGDLVVSFETTQVKDGEKMKNVGNIFAMRVKEGGMERVWRTDIDGAMEDGHIGIAIANGCVFTAFQDKGAYCVDLKTGKVLKNLPEFKAHSNPIFVTVDDKMFWQPECQHGRQKIVLMGATAETFGPLGAEWGPPQNDTTAYGEMPIGNVVVDGRLILRGMDGVYCYDLRK